jgi:hypothetical protein
MTLCEALNLDSCQSGVIPKHSALGGGLMLAIEERRQVHEVFHRELLLAVIISGDFHRPGIHFFTPGSLSQQVAYMCHPAGKRIQPHVHNPVQREVFYTQEVLLIKRGVVRVDFYSSEQQYLLSHVLRSGDVILLVQGGHGFDVLEDVEMIEVKQGPYVGEADKTRFDAEPPAP